MLELYKKGVNIFDLPQDNEAVCVTTNGIVKKDGCAVMGAGIAKQADQLFNLSPKLGEYLTKYGNRAFRLGRWKRTDGNIFTIFSFPTKHDWRNDSDVTLICKSAEQLMAMCDKWNIQKCYLTPPGCGCGKLNYENTVKPWISEILDDRFVVVFNK